MIMVAKVSVIIVNYNGKHWLEQLLPDLAKQTYKNIEVIVVDNASTDESVHWVRKNFPEVLILELSSNLGFAEGNNRGYAVSSGEYILLLNNDTRVEKSYIENYITAFQKYVGSGVAQSKMVLMDDPTRLDACGSFWTWSTYLYHYGFLKEASLAIYNRPLRVMTVKGATLLVSRDVIKKIGLFDNSFWCYYEETDFCHRAWLAGYSCWYLPQAVCRHKMGGTSTQFQLQHVIFHNTKNRLRSFLKNISFGWLVWIFPIAVMNTLLAAGISACLQKNFSPLKTVLQALWWNVQIFPETLRLRQEVQSLRVRTDGMLFMYVTRSPRFEYYYRLFTGLESYED